MHSIPRTSAEVFAAAPPGALGSHEDSTYRVFTVAAILVVLASVWIF